MAKSNPTPIAVLDDYLDLSQPHLSPLQTVTTTHFKSTIPTYPTPASLTQQAARLSPFPVISTMRERTAFPAALLAQLPNLRLLLTTGPRNASIDMAAAQERGVVVTGTTYRGRSDAPEGNDPESRRLLEALGRGFDVTTQHCWALILGLACRLPEDDRRLKMGGGWQGGTSVLLAGRTFGAVGLGRLGARAARTAVLGFGMNVVAWSENLTQEKADSAAKDFGLPEGSFKAVSKKEVFESDVVSIHYVLSDRSRGIVGPQEFEWMKTDSMFVNTSRAGLVDEEALLKVLQQGGIRGAALDVFWEEPLSENSIWRQEKWGEQGKSMVVLSPHMGYVEKGMMSLWYAEQAEEIERWQRGEEPRFKIN